MLIYYAGKTAGMILLVFSCTGLGLWKSMQCQKRMDQIRAFIRGAGFIRGEIQYGKIPLPDALCMTADKMEEPFSGFMRSVADSMEQSNGEKISHIISSCAKGQIRAACVDEKDLNDFSDVLSSLGYLDKEMQIHLLDRYLAEQEEKEKVLMGELPGKKKLFSSLGLLGGIFLVLLLY